MACSEVNARRNTDWPTGRSTSPKNVSRTSRLNSTTCCPAARSASTQPTETASTEKLGPGWATRKRIGPVPPATIRAMGGRPYEDNDFARPCARCGWQRREHGGLAHLGACPDEHGLYARRFAFVAHGALTNTSNWQPRNSSLA